MKQNTWIRQFSKKKWVKHWAGRWHLLNNSLLGYQYTKLLKKDIGSCLEVAVFISHKHYTVAYLDFSYYKAFGSHLAKKMLSNSKQLIYWTNQLMKRTDDILGLIKKLKEKRMVTGVDFEKFIDFFYAYGIPHRVIKIVVDALPEKKLKQFLPALSKARVYAEPVYAETEGFIEHVSSQIAKSTSYKKDHVLSVTKEEMSRYWKTHTLPNKQELTKRFDSCAMIYNKGRFQIFTGKAAKSIEDSVENVGREAKDLSGFSAYPGRVSGIARII